MVKKYLFFLISIVLSGCSELPMTKKDFNDRDYIAFYKSGWSEKESRKPENILEVKKAMLECGYCSPVQHCLGETRNMMITDSEYMMITRWFPRQCMIKSGFTSKAYYYDGKGYLKAPTQQKPDTKYGAIPDRSVERRLNSEWCTEIYPESEVCKP